MNGARIGKASPKKRARTQTEWNKLRKRTAAQIRTGIESDPEVRKTNAAFWNDAKIVLPRAKTLVTMRLDSDLLEWFRRESGYQTRINAILRAYMNAQTPRRSSAHQ